MFSESDEALMALYQAGNLAAFRMLLLRHQKGVFNFLLRTLNRREAAEDALQEVFMRVVKSRHDYKPTAKFTTWLYTLARNFAIDQIRKRKFHDHDSFEDELDKQRQTENLDAFSDKPKADALTSANELNSHLESALATLSPEQREVFLLRETQDLSFEEIANVTKSSVNTVKSRMRYALQALQKYFTAKGITV